MPHRPHKLDLYRRAVQHPEAEVAFLLRAYGYYRKGDSPPLLLKEDFAGGAAVATAWVAADDEHQAMAVEAHGPTARWARRNAERQLGERAGDLHVVEADVRDVTSPKVDLVAATNFSVFIYHHRAALRDYFRAARRSLRPSGLLVVDAYGGPGAMCPNTQTRAFTTAAGDEVEYQWQQRSYDAVTGRVDNRIHFVFPGGCAIRNAFRYDWRLWTLPEVTDAMRDAGFLAAHVWCDRLDPATGQSDGRFRPRKHLPAREDWVAYVVGVK